MLADSEATNGSGSLPSERQLAWVGGLAALVAAYCFSLPLAIAAPYDIDFEIADHLDTEMFSELSPRDTVKRPPVRIDPEFTLAAHRPRGRVRVGYDDGFVIASSKQRQLHADRANFLLQINGWSQLRHTNLNSQGSNPDINQFQLKRARLVFSGHTWTPDLTFFAQFDGRSSSGDDLRLLDYFLTYDVGHHVWGWEPGVLGFKTGKYKIPFTMARYLSGREFEFSDRSVASMYFDVNRSLAWGLYGARTAGRTPWDWEVAIFNGLVTGGAETGSSGNLDNNFAYSGRLFVYPTGEWGRGELADFQGHRRLATRAGLAFATSTIQSTGTTEFSSVRVVDSGATLASLLSSWPTPVDEYSVNLYSMDASCKWRGWSATLEYYFRQIHNFDNPTVPNLFDHGFWFQLGRFVIPGKLQLLTRWSRVAGNSGTLGTADQSAEEIAAGMAWYFREQHSKLVLDVTRLDGAPINSPALDITPGEIGWLFRTQIQLAF